ncbi:hypothetical protein E3N88_22560 [Mikania micrantha]|uniref:Uncharacterized protein n=1 Tax=Mikania micrantha TaxID=192012 RepID=A0A5N6NBV7_9ASTR|nr:hypothetical protein E3N88_22560 [Mikania micrantha]
MVAVVSNHLDRYSNSHLSSLNPTVVLEDVVVDDSRDRDSSSESVVEVQRRENHSNRGMEDSETIASTTSYGVGTGNAVVTGIPANIMAYLPQNLVLSELRHDAFEACSSSGPAESGRKVYKKRSLLLALIGVAQAPSVCFLVTNDERRKMDKKSKLRCDERRKMKKKSKLIGTYM